MSSDTNYFEEPETSITVTRENKDNILKKYNVKTLDELDNLLWYEYGVYTIYKDLD